MPGRSRLPACICRLQIVNGNPAGQAQCDQEFELVASIFDAELVRRRRTLLHLMRCVQGSCRHSLQTVWLLRLLTQCACPGLQGSEVPAIHVIGNHCLSVPRAHLLQRLRIPDTCYYSRRWVGGLSVSGWCGIQAPPLVVLSTPRCAAPL